MGLHQSAQKLNLQFPRQVAAHFGSAETTPPSGAVARQCHRLQSFQHSWDRRAGRTFWPSRGGCGHCFERELVDAGNHTGAFSYHVHGFARESLGRRFPARRRRMRMQSRIAGMRFSTIVVAIVAPAVSTRTRQIAFKNNECDHAIKVWRMFSEESSRNALIACFQRNSHSSLRLQ